MGTEAAGWLEWRQRCALGLCSTGTQAALRDFAGARFNGFMTKFACYAGRGSIAAADAWHLFETHLAVGGNRDGKRYKDWLFARAGLSNDPLVDVIQGGATLLMRDVVREFLRREHSPASMISLARPLVGYEDRSLTLEDLLPGSVDPSCDVERRELERLSEELADRFCHDATCRERVAVLAKAEGLSLAHPEVEAAAGCGKSALNESYRAFVKETARAIMEEFSEDDPDTVRLLVLMTLEKMKSCVYESISAEKTLTRFFMLVKDR